MFPGKMSQTSILVYYKPSWPYNLTTQTLYEVINQVVGFYVNTVQNVARAEVFQVSFHSYSIKP